MARIPKSQIQENLTTQGNEFTYPSSGIPYNGKYHIIQGQAYAGATQSENSTPVLLENPSSNIMAYMIGSAGFSSAAYILTERNIETAKGLSDQYIPSAIIQTSARKTGIHNYFQKSNDPNKIIKEIPSDDVYILRQDPINRVVTIDFSLDNFQQQLAEAEKIIFGITEFVDLVSL